MSASVYGNLRDCQALPRPATTKHMTFWQAIQGVGRHWRSRREGRRTFASLDGGDLHDLALSQGEFELETARWLCRD
jgi:uncharacterized protein YjiS (DUF1127 family)